MGLEQAGFTSCSACARSQHSSQLEQVTAPGCPVPQAISTSGISHFKGHPLDAEQRSGQRACDRQGMITGKGLKIVLSHLQGCLCKLSGTCSGFWGSSSFLGRRASFSTISQMNPPTSQSQRIPMGIAQGTSSSPSKTL